MIAQGHDPPALYGPGTRTQQEINVIAQITEKLIEFAPDAFDFEPRLASDWTQIDDTTLEVELRQGVSFTNGEPFDAESAKFSLDIMLASPFYAAFTDRIKEVTVVDTHTIHVITHSPTLLHMPALAMASFQLPPDYFAEVGEEQFGQAPIGTGPYLVEEWVRGEQITLVSNPDYWGGAPSIQQVTFRAIPEALSRIAALQAGDVDFIIDVPQDAVDQLEADPTLAVTARPSNRLFMLVPSTLTDTPLREPLVRRALLHAIDVGGIVEHLFAGRASVLQGQVLAPSYFGFDPDRQPYEYNPELARQMLADAGYPDGFGPVVFKYPSGRYAKDAELGQVLTAQLEAVGIRITPEVLEPATFIEQVVTLQANDMWLIGNLPPPDAAFMFQGFETGFQYSYYSNADVDRLLTEAASTADAEERQRIYREMMDIFDEDPPVVPLYQPEDLYAARNDLSGFVARASQFLDVSRWSLP